MYQLYYSLTTTCCRPFRGERYDGYGIRVSGRGTGAATHLAMSTPS